MRSSHNLSPKFLPLSKLSELVLPRTPQILHTWCTVLAIAVAAPMPSRRWFFECVQLLLKIKDGITDRIRTISSSLDFGLFALTTQARQYIPSNYVNKFFTLLNWLRWLCCARTSIATATQEEFFQSISSICFL